VPEKYPSREEKKNTRELNRSGLVERAEKNGKREDRTVKYVVTWCEKGGLYPVILDNVVIAQIGSGSIPGWVTTLLDKVCVR
jgi:hypothetical protein